MRRFTRYFPGFLLCQDLPAHFHWCGRWLSSFDVLKLYFSRFSWFCQHSVTMQLFHWPRVQDKRFLTLKSQWLFRMKGKMLRDFDSKRKIFNCLQIVYSLPNSFLVWRRYHGLSLRIWGKPWYFEMMNWSLSIDRLVNLIQVLLTRIFNFVPICQAAGPGGNYAKL